MSSRDLVLYLLYVKCRRQEFCFNFADFPTRPLGALLLNASWYDLNNIGIKLNPTLQKAPWKTLNVSRRKKKVACHACARFFLFLDLFHHESNIYFQRKDPILARHHEEERHLKGLFSRPTCEEREWHFRHFLIARKDHCARPLVLWIRNPIVIDQVPLRNWSHYAIQPCDIRHMAVWLLLIIG